MTISCLRSVCFFTKPFESIYDNDKHRAVIVPAQVLRMSQSECFNDCWDAIVMSTEDKVEVKRDKSGWLSGTFTFNTLHFFQKQGYGITTWDNKPADLESFRKKWRESFDSMSEKRETMHNFNIEQNCYLAEKSREILSKAKVMENQVTKSEANPPAEKQKGSSSSMACTMGSVARK